MSVVLLDGGPVQKRAKVLDHAIVQVMERECDRLSKEIEDVLATVGMDDLPDLVELVKLFEQKVGTFAEELDSQEHRTIRTSATEIRTQMRDLTNEDSTEAKMTKVTNVCSKRMAMQRDLDKLNALCLCIQGWRTLIERANCKILAEPRCELKSLLSKAELKSKAPPPTPPPPPCALDDDEWERI